VLEVVDLRVRFRRLGRLGAWLRGVREPWLEAVAGVSLTIPAATTFALVGESGSGKTTLGRAIIGLAPAPAGSIRFEGVELLGRSERALKPWRRKVAMMFQDPVASLSPRRTVRALIAEPFRIHGLGDRDPKAEAPRLLEMVGLNADFLERYPHELSGGQARRVGVARALALSPRLIIADEPTAGLDVSVQGEVLNLFSRLQAEFGIGYLIITHNLPVVRRVSQLVAIMYLGRLVEIGPTALVFARPAHPYTLALLAATPKPDPALRRTEVELVGEIPSLANRPQGCEFHPRCPFAQPRCRAEAPALRELAPGHWASCHFPFVATS
jgi:oligopeptide/dipeptide ABC transporter ATP-binding protein